jgi:hypothetical protein
MADERGSGGGGGGGRTASPPTPPKHRNRAPDPVSRLGNRFHLKIHSSAQSQAHRGLSGSQFAAPREIEFDFPGSIVVVSQSPASSQPMTTHSPPLRVRPFHPPTTSPAHVTVSQPHPPLPQPHSLNLPVIPAP